MDDGMDVLYLLVPLSLVLVFVIAVIFWWSLKSGQFEDLEGEGFRILVDDDKVKPPSEAINKPLAGESLGSGGATLTFIDPDQ